MARRILKGAGVLVILGVLGIAVLLAAIWIEHRSELTLPNPTGPFAVGRALYPLADSTTFDTLSPVPGTRHELLLWIWYPSSVAKSAAIDDYVPAPMRAAAQRARGRTTFLGMLMGGLTRDPSKVRSRTAREAELSPQEPSYPVVILRGGASAPVVNYSTLAEDLASHGYVVVGFDAPYRTGLVVFPDGRVIGRTSENNPELIFGAPDSARRINRLLGAWTGDIAFVLDRLARLTPSDPLGRFAGRLDMRRVGVFGHSFGGSQAAQFCSLDSRCAAGIDIDGVPLGSVIQNGIHQPFMFVLSDHGDAADSTTRRIQADIQSIYETLPPDHRVRLEIRGANHFVFSDDGALLKSGFVRWVLRRLGMLGIDGRRQLAVTSYCVRSFFDAYLDGASPRRPTITSPFYPEIKVIE